MPPSDACVRSFLYLLYTLIKLYYTKALSDPASSLALDWIRLLRRPRILASYCSATTFQTDAEAETPVLWPPHAKSWLIGKDPDAGKDWVQEEKGMTENEMVGWHHRLNGDEFGWTAGVGDGQGGLACCGSWGREEGLNWTELNWRKQERGGNIELFENISNFLTNVIRCLSNRHTWHACNKYCRENGCLIVTIEINKMFINPLFLSVAFFFKFIASAVRGKIETTPFTRCLKTKQNKNCECLFSELKLHSSVEGYFYNIILFILI